MPQTTNAKAILELEEVTVSFDGFKALDGLNFRMAYGELRFVIGPNGAGKTTLLDVLTGKTRPQRGTVLFDGRVNVTRTPEHELVRQGIARKFQTPTIFPSLTVYENLEAAAGFREGVVGLMGRLDPERQERIEEVLELVALRPRAAVRAGVLAHGEKQWLEMAMLLVQEPKLLLLDEPVAGMTRAERNRTGELLQAIASRCSVLVVEHDMEFVRNFASRVTVLHLGRLLTEGPVAQVQADPRVIEVYIGRSYQAEIAA
ncbi:urea ABC transporter ATP-binding protein UrtD [Litorilinea aerophila]|uniref:Urea ABC transporter ATP-binding protein UrtD n=1 Tax=Litorilinea aerophila TaxID=1204385 RepID=A0A540VB16_9CHLR|nr:urea ABC transporter ATP-binding protein UrtD [Litorilinea aerophila]MCC9078193.1 urea ABC transporter ATP-binding protein UrtD [Litorilinea aerophila]OUC06710.1 urea ABC transporter ATP-binding protein [Litorilinea aerophila]